MHGPCPDYGSKATRQTITALIVTQMSVGRSLKATIDYLMGTMGGAICGGVFGALLGHDSEVALLAGLAIAVGPLALIAAMRQSLTAAPVFCPRDGIDAADEILRRFGISSMFITANADAQTRARAAAMFSAWLSRTALTELRLRAGLTRASHDCLGKPPTAIIPRRGRVAHNRLEGQKKQICDCHSPGT